MTSSVADSARRQQDVLYILTLVTVCIMPLQFLTGLFGMNFVNSDGSAGDPLLNLGTSGYTAFWIIGISMTIIAVWAFRHGQAVLHTGKRLGKAGRQVTQSSRSAARKSIQKSTSRLNLYE